MDGSILAALGYDHVADHFGMKLESAGEGCAVVSLEIDERHLNGIGIVHGGVIFALADVAFALAANGRGAAVSASSTVNFCASAKSGILRASASEIFLSRKLGTYQVTVTDETGKTVALFQGLAYRKE